MERYVRTLCKHYHHPPHVTIPYPITRKENVSWNGMYVRDYVDYHTLLPSFLLSLQCTSPFVCIHSVTLIIIPM
jgi:hypothetical protein